MPDKKLTDKDIVKALECCVSEQYTCGDCPYQEIKHYSDDEGFEIMPNGKWYDDWSCERWLNVDLLDLINRLQAENEMLNKTLVFEINSAFERGKAEAYKEFAEKLKEGLGYYDEEIKDVVYTEEEVDNLLKELVGEDDASKD